MWWNVLIVPSGIRYKVRTGNTDVSELKEEYDAIERRAKVKFALDKGKNPDKALNDWNIQKELQEYIQKSKAIFSEKFKVDLVPNNIIQMIKSTEPDNLDILVDLDIDDARDFDNQYGRGIQGAIDLLSNANEYMLRRSSWHEIEQKILKDYRYSKLSPAGKKQALERAKNESKMKDASLINTWIKKLETSIKDDNDNDASIFDGLK